MEKPAAQILLQDIVFTKAAAKTAGLFVAGATLMGAFQQNAVELGCVVDACAAALVMFPKTVVTGLLVGMFARYSSMNKSPETRYKYTKIACLAGGVLGMAQQAPYLQQAVNTIHNVRHEYFGEKHWLNRQYTTDDLKQDACDVYNKTAKTFKSLSL